MIDREKTYVGMPVIRRSDGKQLTITGIDKHARDFTVLADSGSANRWYLAEYLDYADPPANPPDATAGKGKRVFNRYDVDDTIRIPHYDTVGKGAYRVWQIIGVHLGATHQEGTYALKPLDIEPNEPIHVPCLMLETHPEVEKL